MKKILSLALAASLALSMGVNAFAFDWGTSAPARGGLEQVLDLGHNLPSSAYSDVEIQPGDSDLVIGLTRELFGATGTPGTPGGTTTYENTAPYYTFQVNAANVTGKSGSGIFENGTTTPSADASNSDVQNAILAAIKADIASKTTWASLVTYLNGKQDINADPGSGAKDYDYIPVQFLSGGTITSLTTPASGASATNDTLYGELNGKIAGITVSKSDKKKAGLSSATAAPETAQAGEIIGAVTTSTPSTPGAAPAAGADPTVKLTSREISNYRIDVRTSYSKGKQVFENISINNRTGELIVEWVDQLPSTKDVEFEATIYLTIDGKSYRDKGLTIYGTMSNQVEEGDGDTDYFYFGDGAVLDLTESARKVELDLGNGVIMRTRLPKGKYYGTASMALTRDDEDMLDKYPSIDWIITLDTVGLSRASGNVVDLSEQYGRDYYVYGVGFDYLGRSREMLPYSGKYYLSTEELDVDEPADEPADEPSDSTDEPVEEPSGSTGGGGNSGGGNSGASPDTGANGMLNAAVAAALVSLAAAGVVARKKK